MTTSKLCTYVQIKEFESAATFVKADVCRSQRSIMARMLCSILPLEVKVGRFRNIKKELRFCKLCDGGVIEDEMHFVFDCTCIEDAREEFLKPLSDLIKVTGENNFQLFKRMIGPDHIRDTAAIIEKLFYARQDIVYCKNKSTVP